MWVLDKITEVLNLMLIWVAGAFMAAMILLTCANIVFRLTWLPIRGTFELMGYFGAVITAFALGYTQLRKGHISVDIVVLGFPEKIQGALHSINYFICMIFFAIAAWQIAKYGTNLMITGEVTETLRIIYYPFTYCVAFGCASLSLVFLNDFLKSLIRKTEG